MPTDERPRPEAGSAPPQDRATLPDRSAGARPRAAGSGPFLRIAGEEHRLPAVVATLALGVAGALAASWAGTPLPWLLGAVLAVGLSALAGLRVAGGPLGFPIRLRYLLVPVIGVSIGGAFTPELVREAAGWWPTLLALAFYVPLAHLVSYTIYRRLGGYDRATAYFSAMPGGFVEAIQMGEAAGADPATLSLLQFSRLISCILIVPLAITAWEGMAVGSAAGAALDGGGALTAADAAILLAAGGAGVWAALRLRVPAALITGPILASGAVHLAGLTEADPPGVLIQITQLVIGCTLGVRFVGLGRGRALRGLGFACASVLATLLLALLAGAVLHLIVDESVETVLLAFAPGGVIEMSLIALSLQISVVFVSAHHVARILYTVFVARLAHDWLRRHRGWP